MRPPITLINDSSKLLFYHDIRNTNFTAHNSNHTYSRTSPSEMTQINSRSFFFQVILLLNRVNKRPRVYPSDIYLTKYIHGYKTTTFFFTSSMTSTSLINKTLFPKYKLPRVLCNILSDIHIPTTKTLPYENHTQHT